MANRLMKLMHDDVIREYTEIGRVRLTTYKHYDREGFTDVLLITRVDCFCDALNEYFTHAMNSSEVGDKEAHIDHCIPILKSEMDAAIQLRSCS